VEKTGLEEERARALLETLLGGESEGVSSEEAEELKEKMNVYLGSTEAGELFAQFAVKVENLSGQLKKPPGTHGHSLEEIMASLVVEMQEEKNTGREKEKADLAEKIRESIRQSLRNTNGSRT
jgi:hypothetical protein